MDNNLQEQICKAVDTIVAKRLGEQDNDHTIIAEIISCIDEAKGMYRVQYQDGQFIAYASDITYVYPQGTKVEIILSNDSKDKKRVIKGGGNDSSSYLSLINEYDIMIRNSENAFSENEIELNNLNLIYLKDNFKDNIINYSLQQDDYFVIESNIKVNNLENLEGKINFGFKITLNVFKNLSQNDIWHEEYEIKEYTSDDFDSLFNSNTYYYEKKDYYFTVADMEGNPFIYNSAHKVHKIFDISNEMIYNIDKIEIFSDEYLVPFDYSILFSDICMYTAKKMTEEERNTYNLRISSNVYPFYNSDNINENMTLKANLFIKGRAADLETNSTIYWFREDASVNVGSEYYSAFGGVGWRCLNNRIYYNKENFIWSNGKPEITLPVNTLGIKDKFKVVVHYGGVENRQIIEKTYYKIENAKYRNNKYFNDYNIKCYYEDEEINSFYGNYKECSIICNIPPGNIGNGKFYYWTRSENNGMYINYTERTNTLKIVSQDVIGKYCYFNCTVLNNDGDIVFSDYIKIYNKTNEKKEM